LTGSRPGKARSSRARSGSPMSTPWPDGCRRYELCSSAFLRWGTTSGPLAKEYDSVRGRQDGQLPQAFTHLGVVDTAQLLAAGVARTPTGRWLARGGSADSRIVDATSTDAGMGADGYL
jgi:hypothetical protein